MEKATYICNFNQSNLICKERYIHKYYLPTHLKRIVFPIDIRAISPEAPSVRTTIYYKDLLMEKQIDAETCRQIGIALKRYRIDCQERLLAAEKAYCFALNQRLISLSRQVVTEIERQERELHRRLDFEMGFLTDFEIGARLTVYLLDNDSCNRLIDGDDQNDWDGDVSMIVQSKCLHKAMFEDDEVPSSEGFCWLFRHLTEHIGIPRKHLSSRVGKIWTEVVVSILNELNL